MCYYIPSDSFLGKNCTMSLFLASCSRPVALKDVVLGEDPVKVLSSLCPATVDDVDTLIDAYNESAVDVIEWRRDFLQTDNVKAAARKIAAKAAKPLLWTLRSKLEGGELAISNEDYYREFLAAATSGLFAALDAELMRGISAEDIAAAHKAGTAVVMSYHNFDRTPDNAEMAAILERMDSLGADVLKIAVMPQCPEDVMRLMTTVGKACHSFGKPVIAMSMGELGKITRVSGALFGSCATFASVLQTSAPGQISAEKTKELLALFSCS